MIAFALAAALATQTGPMPGQPGVVGYPGQDPAAAKAASVAYRQSRFIDTAPRVDFDPFGGAFVTPSRTWPQQYGTVSGTRYISPREAVVPSFARSGRSRPPGFASRATVPNRPKTLRESRYPNRPAPGSNP